MCKGAQVGFTIPFSMDALEKAKLNKYRGIGYWFPSETEVSDFAKARFGPMMTNNMEIWGKFVHDTDSAALKRIGNTFLYFRGVGQRGGAGASKSTSKLKSIPLDIIYLDERDEMDDTRVDAVEHRLDAAMAPQIVVLSTPTLPGYGVDHDYALSNQSVWMWLCDKCGEWTCLDLTYPDCIVQPINKDPYYRCSRAQCHAPLTKNRGQWVARKPDVTDHLGYWVSQLSSPTKTAGDIVTASLKAIETGRRSEFENQTLARAFAEVDEEITEQQLLALLTDEQKPLHHEGPAAFGCDPGKPHWYEVRIRLTENDSQVIARGRADTYEELSRIWKQYNCESGVMDKGYDPSAVARFCESHPGCYGGLYVGGKTSTPDWNHKEREVKMGRTTVLDAAHDAIITKRVKHYRRDEFFDKFFVPQMRNLKRATVENKNTGDRRGQWVVTGGQKNDHLRHADAYCNVALERCGIAHSIRRAANDRKSSRRSGARRSAMTI